MGISTVASYRGAQVFQAVGLSAELVDEYFAGTPTPVGGVGLDVIAAEVLARHLVAYPPSGVSALWRPEETTNGAARVRSTCSTRTPFRASSTPHAPAGATSSAATPTRSMTSRSV